MYKPDGYTSVSAYLVVDDARRLAEFLAQVFGARQLRNYERPDGSIMHSEMRIDDSVLMFGEPNAGWPVTASNVHVYVLDVDETYATALAAGAMSLQEPTCKGDPDKRGGVEFAGVNWWIATTVENEP